MVEAALAHVTPGVAGDYNRATYWAQRVVLAQWWADRCDEMREERPAKVIALRPAVGVLSEHPVKRAKRGRPRNGRKGKNKPWYPRVRELIAEGWMHGGMVDDVDRERRRKPNPSDDELALLAEMLDARLYAFVDLVHAVGGAAAQEEISTVLRAQAVEIRRRREQGEDVTIPGLDPTLALIFGSQAGVQVLTALGDFGAGCAERHRPRTRGEKIIRPDFGDDAVGQARSLAFELGLNFRRAPHRPKDSAAEVARKIKLRGQEGAADVRYRARKRLPK